MVRLASSSGKTKNEDSSYLYVQHSLSKKATTEGIEKIMDPEAAQSSFAGDKGIKEEKKRGGLGHTARWEEMFSRLMDFRAKHGHCLVPNRYADDPKLGTWVATQRRQYKALMSESSESTSLTPERVQRLKEIGFSWSPKESDSWDGFYKEYVDFATTYGSDRVAELLGSDSPLTLWESKQREEYALLKSGRPSRLTTERVNLLSDVGFNWGAAADEIKAKTSTKKDTDTKRTTIEDLLVRTDRSRNMFLPASSGSSASASIPCNSIFKKRQLTKEGDEQERSRKKERERQLEAIARSLAERNLNPPNVSTSTINNGTALETKRLGIAAALEEMASPLTRYRTNAELLEQRLNQMNTLPDASRSACLLPGGAAVGLNTSSYGASILGSLHHHHHHPPLPTSLQNRLHNPLQDTLQQVLQNPALVLQSSVGLPPAALSGPTNGPTTTQALLASFAGGGGGGGGAKPSSAQSEIQAILAGKVRSQPDSLISEYLRNNKPDSVSQQRIHDHSSVNNADRKRSAAYAGILDSISEDRDGKNAKCRKYR